MKYDPMYLLFECYTHSRRIITDPVTANIYFGFDDFLCFRKIKSYDIRVVVVLQVFPIYITQILVGAKNEIYMPQLHSFHSEQIIQKVF